MTSQALTSENEGAREEVAKVVSLMEGVPQLIVKLPYGSEWQNWFDDRSSWTWQAESSPASKSGSILPSRPER
jgi:hypothetical protein